MNNKIINYYLALKFIAFGMWIGILLGPILKGWILFFTIIYILVSIFDNQINCILRFYIRKISLKK